VVSIEASSWGIPMNYGPPGPPIGRLVCERATAKMDAAMDYAHRGNRDQQLDVPDIGNEIMFLSKSGMG
jgi:hypothetical protein